MSDLQVSDRISDPTTLAELVNGMHATHEDGPWYEIYAQALWSSEFVRELKPALLIKG